LRCFGNVFGKPGRSYGELRLDVLYYYYFFLAHGVWGF
jgi:hypothetical protein